MSTSLKLEELKVYKVARDIGETAWLAVEKWDQFARGTLGKQFVRAADSIAFKISEGYGRYQYKENKNFCYYSRGSARETMTAVEIAVQRNLMPPGEADLMKQKLELFLRLLHGYIQAIGKAE